MKLRIEKLVFGGAGLARQNDKTYFVKKSVPNDEVEIEILKDKKSFAEAKILDVINPSDARQNPACPYFNDCGGCDHQNIRYVDQLKFKEEIFKETIMRAGIETDILPIISATKEEFFYRNTIRFFSVVRDNQFSFAMHNFSNPNSLISIDKCFLQSELANDLMQKLSEIINNDCCNKNDFLGIRIREGKATGQFMIELITKNNELENKEKFIKVLKEFPEIKSAYQTISESAALTRVKRKLLYGAPIIYEKIGKYTFQLSPESFFQTNSLGAKTLYDKIKEFADIRIGESVLDLYCGTGTISTYLSTFAKKIIGIEIVQSAINDAHANAKINKVKNCEFICSDVERWLRTNKETNIDKIILDPPRDGLTKELILKLSTLNFKNLIYVSCNPSTFARDIKEFEKHSLKLLKTQPIDMFAQIHHIECIGIINRTK